MKIEFGGGKSPKKIDWIQCDIQDLPNIDIVCDAWKITDHVEKNSVEEIYSRHFLEHLTFAQAEACIKSWSAILKPDGKIQIIVPNLEWHFKQFFDFEFQYGNHRTVLLLLFCGIRLSKCTLTNLQHFFLWYKQ